jgi:hypothetical protein
MPWLKDKMSKFKAQMKFQIPNANTQMNSNHRIPRLLVIGVWELGIVWDL